ncbi:MAG: hypothetical protein RL204_981 [Bacteroidota bacterium]|jgi:hypothetical protein
MAISIKSGKQLFKFRLFITIVTISCISSSVNSQNTFENYYDPGGNFSEFGYSVTPTFDGGFVVAGRQGININTVNLLLMKIDSMGQTIWYKSIGAPNTQTWAYSVSETSDSGLIATGLHSDVNGNYSVYVLKANSLGDTAWTKKYIVSGQNAMVGADIIEAPDSGYVLLCDYVDDIDSNWALQLLKLNDFGDTLWSRRVKRNSGVISGGISPTSDGGYVLAGTINPSGNDNSILLVRTDGLLDTLWCKELENPTGLNYILNRTRCVQETNDGGYFICGTAWDINNSTTGVLLIKTDNFGDTLWTRVLSISGTETGSGGGFETDDNGFILTGGTGSSGNGDALLVKTNSLGVLQWSTSFGGINNDLASAVIATSDNGFLICGMESSWGDGSGIYVVRTDSTGFAVTGINETHVTSVFDLTIYPNPVVNAAKIDLGPQWDGNECLIQVLDIAGNIILEITSNNRYAELNAEVLNAGVYVCTVIYADEQTRSSKLFIVQ